MLLTFTRGHHGSRRETRRVGNGSVDCASRPRVHHLVAVGSRAPGLSHMEWTYGLLETRRGHPLERKRAVPRGSELVAAAAVERQPGVRRVPRRDLAAP